MVLVGNMVEESLEAKLLQKAHDVMEVIDTAVLGGWY